MLQKVPVNKLACARSANQLQDPEAVLAPRMIAMRWQHIQPDGRS